MSEPRLCELKLLTPDVRLAVAEGLRLANSRGIAVLIYETMRTNLRQAELYAQGRTTKGVIVTNAKPGESKHNPVSDGLGRAIDAVPWDFALTKEAPKSKLEWNPFSGSLNEQQFKHTRDTNFLVGSWRVMVDSFEAQGLEWAGRWNTFTEYVHFQGK